MRKKIGICLGMTVVCLLSGCGQQGVTWQKPDKKTDSSGAETLTIETASTDQALENSETAKEETDLDISAKQELDSGYLGSWKDENEDGYRISISSMDGLLFDIEIHRNDSAQTNSRWFFTGQIDADTDELIYAGGKSNISIQDEQTQEEIVYSNGSGMFWLDELGKLHWVNDVELEGNDLIFERISGGYSENVIEPLSAIFTELADEIPDGEYPISFTPQDLIQTENGYELMTVFFTYDTYDETDIQSLSEGSLIRIQEKEVEVRELNWWDDEDRLDINGGYALGGTSVMPDENNGFYRTFVANDFPEYYVVGITNVPVSEMVKISDTLPETLGETKTEEFPDCILKDDHEWTPYNTTAVFQSGQIVSISRSWIPDMD